MRTTSGHAAEITLPSGKRYYVGVWSISHVECKDAGLPCKIVSFTGCCISCNINDRAHSRFPVTIDGVDLATCLETVATDEEFRAYRAAH